MIHKKTNGVKEYHPDGRPVIDFNGSNIVFGKKGLTYDEALESYEFGKNKNGDLIMGENASLRREDYTTLEPEIFGPHALDLQGRNLVGTQKEVGPAGTQWQYDKWDHMSAAEYVARSGRRPRDETSLSRTSVTILEISKGWTIPRRDTLGSTPVEAMYAQSALLQCQEKFNSMIFESADEPNIDGLIDSAGNTDAGTSAWSNLPTTGDAYEDIRTLKALLRADGFGGGALKLGAEPANYGELETREVKAGGSANTYKNLIEAGLVDEVLNCPGCPNATAVLVDQSPNVAIVLRGEEFKVRIFEMDSDHQIKGDVTGVFSIAVPNANGVGTETGI